MTGVPTPLGSWEAYLVRCTVVGAFADAEAVVDCIAARRGAIGLEAMLLARRLVAPAFVGRLRRLFDSGSVRPSRAARSLGAILVEQGWVRQTDIEEAISRQRAGQAGMLGEILVAQGRLTEERVGEGLAIEAARVVALADATVEALVRLGWPGDEAGRDLDAARRKVLHRLGTLLERHPEVAQASAAGVKAEGAQR